MRQSLDSFFQKVPSRLTSFCILNSRATGKSRDKSAALKIAITDCTEQRAP